MAITHRLRNLRSACIAVLCTLGSAFTAGASQEFYLSPTGDDANPGTAALPFASLDRARQAVRTVNASMSEDVIVHLAPGDYPVSSPVEFGPLDSGFNGHEVIYRASGAAGSARLVGGELVSGWQPWQGEIVYANVGVDAFHTLYENGRRVRKARFPNLNFDSRFPLAQADYLLSTGVDGSHTELRYAAGAFDPSGWNLSGLQVHVWSGGKWDWFTDTTPVASIDTTNRIITLSEEVRYPLLNTSVSSLGSRFYLQGALALLDAPGEFHHDSSSGRLYYWPVDGAAADQEIVVPRTRRVISLQGDSETSRVHDLRFEGLGVEFTDFTGWYRHGYPFAGGSGEAHTYPEHDRQATMREHREGAVRLENTERITFDSCQLRNSGYSGFFSYGANRNNAFRRCRVAHAGMNGLTFEGRHPGEGDVQTLNTVENCLIESVGELAGEASGVQLTNASNHEISHCAILGSPRYGVCLNAYRDIPRADIYAFGNHIHHIRMANACQDSGDGAALYAWGLSDDAPFLSNTFEQIIIDDSLAHPSMDDYPPHGVYMDNDSYGQVFSNIEVRNFQGNHLQLNESGQHIQSNVSWQSGFNPALMAYASIDVLPDFPFPVPPSRIKGTRVSGDIELSWLPVANAASYTVWVAETPNGPWQVLVNGLTGSTHRWVSPPFGRYRFRVTSTGPGGAASEPSGLVQVNALPTTLAGFTVVEMNPFASGGTPGNTVRADGSGTFWSSTVASNTDGLWRERTTTSFGYDNLPGSSGRIFEAAAEDQANAPALRTSVTNLPPAIYQVVVLYTSRTDGETFDIGGTRAILNGTVDDPRAETFTRENADSAALAVGDAGNAVWGTYFGDLGLTEPGATGFTVDMAGAPGTNRSQVMAVAYRRIGSAYSATLGGLPFTVVEVDPFFSGGTPGNTQRADASGTFWANTSSSNEDGLWRERTTPSFGYDNIPGSSGRIFEASLADQSGAPNLRQTVSGLVPGSYQVVLLYTSRTDGNTADMGGTRAILNGVIGAPGTETFTWQNADSGVLAAGDGSNAIWGTYYGELGTIGPDATGFTVDMGGAPGTSRSHLMAVAYRALDSRFNGGDMLAVGNWTNGLPVAPVIGASSQTGSFNAGSLGVADWLLTVTGGTITAGQDWRFTGASKITMDNGTLEVVGSIRVEDSGRLIFNGGTISWGGDFGTGAGVDSMIVINGGTFTGGAGSRFGNAAGSGTMMIHAGTVSAATIDFSSPSSFATLGGNASISGESAVFGSLDIETGWSGTMTIDSFSGSDWQNVFQSGGITYHGAVLDASGFAATFFVSPSGKSLGTEPFVVTEPKLTAVGFNASGDFVVDATGLDPRKTYQLKRGTNLLTGFPDMIGDAVTGVASMRFIDPEPPVSRTFFYVLYLMED